MKDVAVIITFSFDSSVSVLLFDDYAKAVNFIRADSADERRIDVEENGWGDITEYYISEEGDHAVLTNHFEDSDDVTEWRIGTVYNPSEVFPDL